MPRQYSPQFRERVLALMAEGRDARTLAVELGISVATIYRWRRQAMIDAGRVAGTNSRVNAELVDARRRIRELEEELSATKPAASMLRDEGIRPKDGSRWSTL